MNKHIKNIVAGGLLITTVVAPSVAFKYKNEIKELKAQQEAQLEEFKIQKDALEGKIDVALKQLSEKESEIADLKQINQNLQAENDSLEGVQQTIINNVGYFPNTYERELLERLVECEAGAESLTGKIAVANVVLNRIKAEEFPDSISGVIYQKNQFEPVITGIINSKTPSAESREAVKRAFLGEKVVGEGILYFWASWLDSGNDLWNHVDIVQTIGVHHFGRSWN